jgi:uncharacterized membrane protein YdcZ (DUF606 family)
VYVTIAVASGGLIALMILANGGLQGRIGALPSLIIIHFMGLVGSTLFLVLDIVQKRGRVQKPGGADTSGPNPPEGADRKGAAPLWFATAGIMGIAVVFLNNLIYSKGGVLLALGGTLAGQTLVAHLLEGTRWFDGRKSPLFQRILSLALVLPGAAIIGLRSGVGIGWVGVSWIPGAILMVQSMMNTRNALRWGQPKMLLLNYATALAVLLPLFGIYGGAALATTSSGAPGGIGSFHALFKAAVAIPFYISLTGGLIGVIVIGTSAFLFQRSSAIKVVLGLYAGQIAIGVLLDVLSGLPLQAEKILGVAMVVVGLGAGELHRIRTPKEN